MSIKGGYGTAEEAMKSIMESYETLYNQIEENLEKEINLDNISKNIG